MKILWMSALIFLLSSKSFAEKYKTLFVERDYYQPWRTLADTDEKRIKTLLEILIESKHGRKIVIAAKKKAFKEGKTLSDLIIPGPVSLLDTTLLRKFSRNRPDKVIYETKAVVYVNSKLKTIDAVLDLAHELTHYIKRTPFNPYQVNFSLEKFIKSTVEGKGGEVDAYLSECKVVFELFKSDSKRVANCKKVSLDGSRKLSRKLTKEKFYRLGNNYDSFKRNLSNYSIPSSNIPDISNKDAVFISSAYGQPYPVAALEEYKTIMNKACENDDKRLALLTKKADRAPASAGMSVQVVHKEMMSSFVDRCNIFYDIKHSTNNFN